MTDLLVFREQLKKFYSKYELYLTPVFKFLLALVTLVMINSSIGYMSELKKTTVVLVLALMCSVLPMNFIVVVATAVTLGHLYKFSLECALVMLVLFLLLFILYFRFASNDTIAVLLTPLCFILKIPYIIPIAMGLVGTPASAVPAASGAGLYLGRDRPARLWRELTAVEYPVFHAKFLLFCYSPCQGRKYWV